MARITMRNSQKATFAEVFEIYISAVTARGVKDKTLATYKQHFHAISKRLDNAIGAVTVKQKKLVRRKKEIAAAVYEYQADYDGEWGEIEIDFEKGTGKISYIAELDTTRSHRFANKAIEEILNSDLDDLPKQKTIAFTK